jgi:Fur family iron response transcriptional regulator
MQDTPQEILDKLDEYKIRPTKIRKAIAGLLFDGSDKHVTVDDVIDMARAAKIKTSVASVYNTLNQFAAAGLLHRVTVEQGRAFFDTNLSDHHHFYYEDEARLEDIPASSLKVSGLPALPRGRKVKSVEVTIRL